MEERAYAGNAYVVAIHIEFFVFDESFDVYVVFIYHQQCCDKYYCEL